ncbi:glycoside hydrolase family protein, partial [mine drainage metagenome]
AAPTPLQGTTHGGYDAAEPQGPWGKYQDFGHNHWHNSLIWGVGLHDVAILGPGLIHGKGLSDGHLVSKSHLPNTFAPGVGNKSIALKDCRNVLLRDFSILQGGWFGILATGVDNLVIDHLTVDTNRDGMDIDCCRNVRIVNTTINSPNDDGMCLKSSYALGYLKPTQDVTISDCWCAATPWAACSTALSSRCHPATAPGASSAAPNPTAASSASPSATACSSVAGAWHWKPWTAARCRTSPSTT